ncbi:MAG: NADH-quinone oxidoreductase subunit F, partial [Lachnospiraceae bacterium]|nr:NADH-quinone oxidoreductase subunit F [Lachnospiraceae bacterium]
MKSLEEIKAIRKRLEGFIAERPEGSKETRIVVGMATCGIASGARPVLDAITEEVVRHDLSHVVVMQTGCIGLCQYEPVVEVYEPGKDKVTYIKMNPGKAAEIVEQHIMGGKLVENYMLHEKEGNACLRSLNESVFYKNQERIALRNCGVIDPEKIDEYIATGGYEAIRKVLTEMTPDEVIQTILDSGLRG